jgi:hypothetical protein
MKDNKMATHKRLTITMHPLEIAKLKEIAKENQETISGMITRFVMEYKRKDKK